MGRTNVLKGTKMGTITITELSSVGGQGAVDGSPVVNISAVIKTTVDSTTSATAESMTLDPNTRYVIVKTDADHRLSVKSTEATDQYLIVSSGVSGDFAVNAADRTLYYRTDA